MNPSCTAAPRTAKTEILRRLAQSPTPLAVHEFHIEGYSENNIATRLSELAKAGKVLGVTRPGKPFKEWVLIGGERP